MCGRTGHSIDLDIVLQNGSIVRSCGVEVASYNGWISIEERRGIGAMYLYTNACSRAFCVLAAFSLTLRAAM